MEKVKQIIINKKKYYLVADFFYKKLGKKRAITSIIEKIPKTELYSSVNRGRNSGVYSTIEGIKAMLSKMQRIPLDIKMEFGIYNYTCSETEFGYILEGFLKTLNIPLIKQHRFDKYNVDFYIKQLNLIIEFDEYGHKFLNNENRNILLLNLSNVIYVKSTTNIGCTLAEIVKYIYDDKNSCSHKAFL